MDPTPAQPYQTPPPESPTGTPWLPPAVAKYVTMGILVALAVLGVLMGVYPEIHAIGVSFAVLTAVAAVLGISSPGLRTPTVKMLAIGALGLTVVSASGCAWWQKTSTKLLNCVTTSATSALPEVMGPVGDALRSSGPDAQGRLWEGQLEALGIRYGLEVIGCAVLAIIQSLESGTGGGAGAGYAILETPAEGSVAPPVMLLRGYSWMDGQKMTVTVSKKK